jgi:CRP/FNR family cyclic AMP-dependent transcriptional regulator
VPGPAELLRKIGLFESLSQRQIQRLAVSLKERNLSKGDVILSEGKSGIGFFVIGEGTVTYNVHGKDVGTGGPGDYFGEIALIDDRPRMATVTAATDVTIYAMTRWEFRGLSEEHPDIASGLRQVMAKRESTED